MTQARGLSLAVNRTTSSAIRDLLSITDRPEVISLAGGLPDPATFPVEEIATALAESARDDPAALQYSATGGFGPLRSWIGSRQGVAPDHVVVTNGSQQALQLVIRATVDPGGTIAMADPGYVGAIQAARMCGARLLAVPSDGEGLCVDHLADALDEGQRPALVYIVANFHNPTGVTLSAERRMVLVELADRFGFLIVEDDPYGELRWSGSAPPSLWQLSADVVSLGTISKLLCPGLRVGWVVAPPWLALAVALLKQAEDLHTSSIAQRAVHRVLTSDGFLGPHIARLVPAYGTKARALASALTDQFGDRAQFQLPEGGMFLWVRLEGVDTAELLSLALDAGMAFVPGSAFGIDAAHADALRLSFATVSPERLGEGVRRLAAAVEAYEQGQKYTGST